MRAVDLIVKKREGKRISEEEISFLMKGYASGGIPDYQISAFLMAAFLNGLDFEETYYLTQAMVRSGDQLRFDQIPGVKVDKHSTGGVGDKISLILAPIAAACGCKIPMMSGRGLGHTGGTLDKLESIPGYRVFLRKEEIERIIHAGSFVMMGQTENIVPADKLLYALRDVTGTVESIPLITSSIMSKKIAEGSEALVLDLKCGRGAFMKDLSEAQQLGEFILNVAKRMGLKMVVVISDMDEPLGRTVGNYVEVLESVEALQGGGEEQLMELTYRLSGWMLVLSGLAGSIEEAVKTAKNAVISGEAFRCFLENIRLQGGDPDFILNPKQKHRFTKEVASSSEGYLQAIDSYSVGLASMMIGCGRKTKEDPIDPYAGIVIHKRRGEWVRKGESLFSLFYNDADIGLAEKLLSDSVKIGEERIEDRPIVIKEMKDDKGD